MAAADTDNHGEPSLRQATAATRRSDTPPPRPNQLAEDSSERATAVRTGSLEGSQATPSAEVVATQASGYLCSQRAVWRIVNFTFAYHVCVCMAVLTIAITSIALYLINVCAMFDEVNIVLLVYVVAVLYAFLNLCKPLLARGVDLMQDAFAFGEVPLPILQKFIRDLQKDLKLPAHRPRKSEIEVLHAVLGPAFICYLWFHPSSNLTPSWLCLFEARRFLILVLSEISVLCIALMIKGDNSARADPVSSLLSISKAAVIVLPAVEFTFEATLGKGIYKATVYASFHSAVLPACHWLMYVLIPVVQDLCHSVTDALNRARRADHDSHLSTSIHLFCSLIPFPAAFIIIYGLEFLMDMYLPKVFASSVPNMLVLRLLINKYHDSGGPRKNADALRTRSRVRRLFANNRLVVGKTLAFIIAVLLALARVQHERGQTIAHSIVGSIIEDDNITGGKDVEIWHLIAKLSLHINRTYTLKKKRKGTWAGTPYGSDTARPSTGYALCDMEWGGIRGGLRLLDFALLSHLAYFDYSDQFLQEALPLLFDQFVTGIPRILQGVGEAGPGGNNTGGAKFYIFEFPLLELSVAAIRGTDPLNPIDILQDAHLWIEAAMLTWFGEFLPTIRWWPQKVTQRLILCIHRIQEIFRVRGRRHHGVSYYVPIEQALIQQMARKPATWQFLATGHSLGGGLASIVGSHLNLPAIAFSPPGVLMSALKMTKEWSSNEHDVLEQMDADQGIVRDRRFPHVGPSELAEFSVTVVPTRDPVPHFDEQFGLKQMTICNRQNAIECHLIGGMVCDLLARCGDEGRYRFSGCSVQHPMS